MGTEAVAAVGIAGNLSFLVLALSQMLGVGTTTVVSHAVGRKDHPQAQLLFNQSQVLAMLTGVLFLIVGLAARMPYAVAQSADANTSPRRRYRIGSSRDGAAIAGAMGSALRAAGNSSRDGRSLRPCHNMIWRRSGSSVGDRRQVGVAGAASPL